MSWNGPTLEPGRDADLDLLGLARLVRRVLQFLGGLRRHLVVLALGSTLLLLVGLASFLILAPALWNGVLQGKEISPLAGRLLGLDPAQLGAGVALTAELRRMAAARLTWVMGGIAVAITAGSMSLIYYGVWILQRLNQLLRMQILDRLQALSLRFHDQSRVGDAIYRTYQDSAMVTQVVQSFLLVPAFALLRFAVVALALAAFSPRFAVALLLLWVPLGLAGAALGTRLRGRFRLARASNSALTSQIQESLSGMRVIKAFGLDRAFELLEQQPEVADAPDARPLARLEKSIAFRDVSFAYRVDRPALVGVDFEAPVGGITALVGPTGAGKSTVMALLLRLFDPDTGAIELDGVDLRALRVADLRRAIAIALQENVLFAASVRENIRYARPKASDAEVRAAARVACADEFIAALPGGYETELGERGARLSTGQRQRLTLARALLKDPQILLLDEPTASLDAETEQRLVRSLAEWGRGRCILLVTHRLSTVRLASRVVFLDHGKVIERGAPDELLARPGGAYRALVETERGHSADALA